MTNTAQKIPSLSRDGFALHALNLTGDRDALKALNAELIDALQSALVHILNSAPINADTDPRGANERIRALASIRAALAAAVQ